jgi:hypothetical protein
MPDRPTPEQTDAALSDDPAYGFPGTQFVRAVWEGEMLPMSCSVVRVLFTELVPWGTGTATRTRHTLLLSDDRYWLSDQEKRDRPLFARAEARDD